MKVLHFLELSEVMGLVAKTMARICNITNNIRADFETVIELARLNVMSAGENSWSNTEITSNKYMNYKIQTPIH